MKDLRLLETAYLSEPERPVLEAIDFCVRKLVEDDTMFLDDESVPGCTFEELLGALTSARRELGGIPEEAE